MEPSILLQSGNYYHFLDPDKNSFNLEDIAQSLSNTCRFGGHCHPYYSVAQHSILVSQIVPEEFAMAGLMHDAAEAFVGDIPSPFKTLIKSVYGPLEDAAHAAVADRFGLSLTLPLCVKEADLRLLVTEKRDLMPQTDVDWPMIHGYEPMDDVIIPMSASYAKAEFLLRFSQIRLMEKKATH